MTEPTGSGRDDVRSVLGRYSPQTDDGERCEVRLLRFPLQLFEQAREHHDELMREFALLAVSGPRSPDAKPVPARLVELIDTLGRRYGATAERVDAERDAAIARGETVTDLTYDVPRSAAASMRALHELMEAADEFCASEHLLTLASTPAERDFRRWFIEEFIEQVEGREPRPWEGPLTDPDGVTHPDGDGR